MSGGSQTDLGNAIEAAVHLYTESVEDEMLAPAAFGIAVDTIAKLARVTVATAARLLETELEKRNGADVM